MSLHGISVQYAACRLKKTTPMYGGSMMYHIREVVLKSKTHIKKRPVIEFDDSEKAIVGEFLMVDAPLDDWDALDAISEVLDGKVSKRHMSGNRCKTVMTAEKTYICDLFSEAEGVPVFSDCMIETETLRELMVMWKKEVKKYHKQ